jgi:hypothetical protein
MLGYFESFSRDPFVVVLGVRLFYYPNGFIDRGACRWQPNHPAFQLQLGVDLEVCVTIMDKGDSAEPGLLMLSRFNRRKVWQA